jgi:hypothetical protein
MGQALLARNVRPADGWWSQIEVAVEGRIAVLSGHCSSGDVEHLPRRHVVELPRLAVVVTAGELLVHPPPGYTEQRLRLILGCAVRVHLHEHPLRPSFDVDCLFDPCADAGWRRGIGRRDGRALDAESQLPRAACEGDRALDEEDPIVMSLPHPRALGLFVRALLSKIAGRPVDAIDDLRLADVRRRRERVIRVATELEQEGDLVVHPAVLPVRSAVGERPVSVDEREPEIARPVAREVPMAREEREVLGDHPTQALLRVPVVMEVILDLAEAPLAELGQHVEVLRRVLLPRKEERMLRRPTVRVAEGGRHFGIAGPPRAHACLAALARSVTVKRLVVVAESEQKVPRALVPGPERPPRELRGPAGKPRLQVLVSYAGDHWLRS